MTAVEVIVPWRGGCRHRQKAWDWLRSRWAARWPEWLVTVAELPEGPWVKAEAVMPAIAASDAEVVVLADADVWCDAVDQAVAALRFYAWAIPHGRVYRLDEHATDQIIYGTDPQQTGAEHRTENPYPGVAGGGLVAIRREVALDCPLDRRFIGWGGEDHSWGYALATLHGSPWRGSDPLWHLWHPPQPRVSRKVGSAASEKLRKLYYAAYADPDAMRELVNAGRLQEVG